MSARPVVVLVGPPGAGKSTVARRLAARLGVGLRGTDEDVEAEAGRPIAEIFVDDGEPAFRAMERLAVLRALAEHDGVLALGGGAVLDGGVQEALASYRAEGGAVVFLDVSLAAAVPRIGLSRARPLLIGSPRAQWLALMEARRPVYEGVSTLHVATDDLGPDEVAEAILSRLAVPGTDPAPIGGDDEDA